jgi:hypothetical protein
MTKHFLTDVVFDAAVEVPTPSSGDNSTKAASTAFVADAVAGVSGGGGSSEWNAGTVTSLGTGFDLTSGVLSVDTSVIADWEDVGASISSVSADAQDAKTMATSVQTLTTPAFRQTGLLIPFYQEVATPLSDSGFAGLFELIRKHPTVPVIVIIKQTGSDEAGGPGPYTDEMAEQIRLLQAAGAVVAGYVPTGNGTRDSDAVTADIDAWHTLYLTTQPDAIFLDQAPTDVGEGDLYLSIYISYYQYAHQIDRYKLVIVNWGAQPSNDWYNAGVADIRCIYDADSWPTPVTFDIDPLPYTSGAITDYPPRQFAALIRNASIDWNSFLAIQPYFRWVYATDGTGDTPYATLSSFLDVLFLMCRGQDQLWKAGDVRDLGTGLNITDGNLTIDSSSLPFSVLTASQGVQVGADDASGYLYFRINGAAGSHRYLEIATANSSRWQIICSDEPETGSNAGSNLQISSFNDDGTYLSQPMHITRATGRVTLSDDVQIGGGSGPTWTSGSGAPSATEPLGSLYSRSDGGVGTTLYVSRGGGTWNAVSGV